MMVLSILAVAFALSFAVEWMTGRGAVATFVPAVCFAALVSGARLKTGCSCSCLSLRLPRLVVGGEYSLLGH